jgi:hypothetical protein
MLLTPVQVQWVSGLSTTKDDLSVCAADGSSKVVLIGRPVGPGLQSDLEYAAKLQSDRSFRLDEDSPPGNGDGLTCPPLMAEIASRDKGVCSGVGAATYMQSASTVQILSQERLSPISRPNLASGHEGEGLKADTGLEESYFAPSPVCAQCLSIIWRCIATIFGSADPCMA